MGIIWIAIFAIIALVVLNVRLTTEKKKTKIPDGFNPSTTVIQRNGNGFVTVHRDYGGETRYLHGKPLETQDDLDEWNVIMGHGKNMYAHLRRLEDAIGGDDDNEAKAALEQWNAMYTKYNGWTLRHGLYNDYCGDRRPFTGTPEQKRREEREKARVSRLYKSGEANREALQKAKEDILRYIRANTGEDRRKTRMMHSVFPPVGDSGRAGYLKAYRNMIKEGLIREAIHQNRSTYIQLRRQADKRPTGEDVATVTPDTFAKLAQSRYRPGQYADIPSRVRYRAIHTVGNPKNLDREKQTCVFTSEITGETYLTSLEACMCQAYANGANPCKHMVKLKMILYGG